MKPLTNKKIIIIGGGLAGLSAGIYALKAAYEVEIYEKNPMAGGLCMAWERKGYHIDGCIHWLTGTKQQGDLFNLWKDLGAIEDSRNNIIDPIDAGKFILGDEELTLYCDIDKLKEELLKVSPKDKRQINRFIKDLKFTYELPVPLNEPINTMNLWTLTKVGLRLLPCLYRYGKLKKTRCDKYAKRFKSPIIQFMINSFQPGPGSAYPFIYSLATVIYQNGGIPKGGSKAFIHSIEQKYLSLGGKIYFNKPVKNIEIISGVAKGVVLENGDKISGDYIVSAIDAKYLLDVLLDKKYKDKKLDKRFKNKERYKTPTCFVAYYSINKEKIEKLLPNHQTFFKVNPFKVGYRDIYSLKIKTFAYDPYFDKDKDTIIEVLIEQYNKDYQYWFNLYQDKNAYNEEKKRIVDIIRNRISESVNGIDKEDLVYLDSYSPSTLNRYTHSYDGAFMSFMMNRFSPVLFHKGRFKGIKNLYFASQWEQSPGGLPLAGSSGRFAIQRILKKEGRNHLFKDDKK